MSDFEGTSGPWEIIERNGELVVIQSKSFQELTCAVSYISIANELQCQEDASIIAAAPELLEALQKYMSAVEQMNEAMSDGYNVQGAMSALVGAEDMAKAAIKKALGK